jgi:hypothetical protein
MNGAVRVNVKQTTPIAKKTTETKKAVSVSVKKESKVTIRLKDKKCKKQNSNSYYDSGSKKCINSSKLDSDTGKTLSKELVDTYKCINNYSREKVRLNTEEEF